MRLLIKQGSTYAEIFRVGFHKSRHRNVIGEHLIFDFLEALIPEARDFHSHFIYIENGDYHFSLKYFDTAEQLFVDRKTYHNHIAIKKKADSPDFTRTDPVERRDKNLDDPLDCFMMGEKLNPWTVRPLGHHFGTVAVTLNDRGKNSLPWDENIKAKDNDLVIDINQIEGGIINFGVGIFSKGNPAFEFTELSQELVYFERCEFQDDLILRLSVIVVPK